MLQQPIYPARQHDNTCGGLGMTAGNIGNLSSGPDV